MSYIYTYVSFPVAEGVWGLPCWLNTLVGRALSKVMPLFPYLHFKTSSPSANTPWLIKGPSK